MEVLARPIPQVLQGVHLDGVEDSGMLFGPCILGSAIGANGDSSQLLG